MKASIELTLKELRQERDELERRLGFVLISIQALEADPNQTDVVNPSAAPVAEIVNL